MIIKKIKKSFSIGMIAVGLLFTVVGCKKHNTPPPLPSASSFKMDFDNYNNGTAISQQRKMVDSTSENYAFGGTNVLIWNVIATINLAIPTATFGNSFNHQPQWEGSSDSYVWTYDYTVGLVTYTSKLKGKIVDVNTTSWEMYISQSNGFQNVLWYMGTTKNDGSTATWQLNKNANNPVAYLQIDYTKNTDGTSMIKYTNVESGSSDVGGYIEFSLTNDLDYDAHYNIYGSADNNLIELEWNKTTRAGRAKNPKHFGDSVWHCWDTDLVDIVCPS